MNAPSALEVCILAGGQSRRMGKDKSQLRLGGLSLLERIAATVSRLGLPARIITEDLIPGCGPLGGVFSGLKTTEARAVLFLSCDMPFITSEVLRRIMVAGGAAQAVFTKVSDKRGFPFLIPVQLLPRVEERIRDGALSIQALAAALPSRDVEWPPEVPGPLLNVNTPADWELAKKYWATLTQSSAAETT